MDWRENSSGLSDLASKFYSMADPMLYTDVTFILSDGSEMAAHKLILAMASPVFETEFYGVGWMEQGKDRIEIVDDRGVFRHLICYIYSPYSFRINSLGELQVWDLLYLANKYLIKHLETMVEKHLYIVIKNCQTLSLLLHKQKAKENILGEKFLPAIKEQIEIFSELVLSSCEFLNLHREEVLEILNYQQLRVSEGQIFKFAANWCLNKKDSDKDVKEEFSTYFNKTIKYNLLTTEDFIKNVLPHSDILNREDLKNVTKQCVESNTTGYFTRCIQQPFKKVIVFHKKPELGTTEVLENTATVMFPHIEVTATLTLDMEDQTINCIIDYGDTLDNSKDILITGIILNYLDKSKSEHEQKIFVIQKHNGLAKRNIFEHEFIQIDSDVSMEVSLDTRNMVPITIIRQDLLHLDFKTDACSNSIVTTDVNSNFDAYELKGHLKTTVKKCNSEW